MKTGYLLIFGIMLGLSACQWGDNKKPEPDITTDTLVYSYKTIKERAADCGNKPDSGCTVVKIKYPVFLKNNSLNDTLNSHILSVFNIEGKCTSLIQLATNFLKTYVEDTQPKNESGIIYRLNINAEIVRQDSSITTIQISGDTYSGGAHGSSFTEFINWNTKEDKDLLLDDIFNSNHKESLNKVADSIFSKNENLSNTVSLSSDYSFKNGKFSLNRNFLITPIGIRFFYNEYEIKPYSGGTTNLFIPYSKIKSLLKPNTVITQYLK